MIWNWYVATDTELFVDMDRYKESINHVRRRLQGAIESECLNVDNVYLFPSISNNHFHMVVKLKRALRNRYEAFVWEMLLHGDIYRTASNILRHSRNVPAADVFITRSILHRPPDTTCNCESKHNRATMLTCKAAIKLRGEQRLTTFFGKPSDNPCRFLP